MFSADKFCSFKRKKCPSNEHSDTAESKKMKV